jgi:hypothetical protein
VDHAGRPGRLKDAKDAKDAVNLDTVHDDLAGVVDAALEPAHIPVWVRPG